MLAYNVLEAFPGDGLLLGDAETGETIRVVERSASKEQVPMELAEILAPDFMEKMYRTHLYRDWADTQIPSLGNQTPRQCAPTEHGEAHDGIRSRCKILSWNR